MSNIEKNTRESEIINQKKRFIFRVDQTSDYVSRNEVFTYYIYIKNISGVEIDNFTIKIENPKEVVFDEKIENHEGIVLNSNEIKLYEVKAYCNNYGKFTVHFIGYGNETEILHQSLVIRCSKDYNSEETIHRVSIYDFTPYESKYTMEADNYSDEVTQLFKRQKLPYKAKKQPFGLRTSNKIENIESQSFLDQYEEAKNTNEHVYQYLSRENFIEDSIESYTGQNLIEIFNKINKESEYFRAKFLQTGNNELLNDFTQYNPDGFLNRMGLLSSEIYHLLGVLPTYDYMSDYLFRWAPSKYQLLNLYPKKRAMNWDKNVWAGRGWIIHKVVTDEYSKTEEFKTLLQQKLISFDEIVGYFDSKKIANEFINKSIQLDEAERNYAGSDIVKYNYVIKDNLYDNGVFFINIPVDKIPSNFYLLGNDELYAAINRVKPYGTKPIINFVIEKTFDHNMEQKFFPNYYENIEFVSDSMEIDYFVSKNKYIVKTTYCDEENFVEHVSFEPVENIMALNNFIFDTDHQLNVDSSQVGFFLNTDMDMEEDIYGCETVTENKLHTIKDIKELLYQNNYDVLGFYYKNRNYNPISLKDSGVTFPLELTFNELEYPVIYNRYPFDSLKLLINDFEETDFNIILEDTLGKKHKINAIYDSDIKMNYITYTYINKNNKSIVRKEGYQNIKSIGFIYQKINTKTLIIFIVEDKNEMVHYFHHIIVPDIINVDINKTNNVENTNEKPFYNLVHNYNTRSEKVFFETPFVFESETYDPSLLEGGANWTNISKINLDNNYAYIQNISNEFLSPDNIKIFYDGINIPETSNIKKIRLKILGNSSENKEVYLDKVFNSNYRVNNTRGNVLSLTPKKIEAYSHLNESNAYYDFKLDAAKEQNQETYIQKFEKLLLKNYIFNEDIDIEVADYLNAPNDFITIKDEFWCELSEITELTYKLNNISNISLVIEGYNDGPEVQLNAQTVFKSNTSSVSKENIPTGYFRKKIPLYFENNFLLELLRVRFRFKNLNNPMKIFDTKIELTFKTKEQEELPYEPLGELNINEENLISIEEEVISTDITNGLGIKFSFDDLKSGDFYQINSIKLEVIYENTEINIMINDNKYQDIFYLTNKSKISGESNNTYLSGEFYNDVITMSQNNDNISIKNKGIKLQDTLYQCFETRSNNITGIEIFPNGFKGNPDDILRLGLYTNSYNTPGKLIKEIFISGWTKNNEKTKNLSSIKYNFNVDNLEINTKYWFKLEVLNPQQTSYYLLRGLDETQSGFKLLANENNNYINTFSCLKFNIYSKNLSKSFNSVDSIQEYFDNPYTILGLHKNQGEIWNLETNKYLQCFKGISSSDFMGNFPELDNEIELLDIIIEEVEPSQEDEFISEDETGE